MSRPRPGLRVLVDSRWPDPHGREHARRAARRRRRSERLGLVSDYFALARGDYARWRGVRPGA